MDDREKLAIREEFTSRIWWLVAGIVLLSGVLLWMWFEDKGLYHYLWLVVLPWVFLVPLLRYHRALRSLTQPNGGTGLADSGAETGAALAMNDAVKASIRRIATTIHWVAQVFLILLVALGVFARWGFRMVADSFSDMQTVGPSSIVTNEFSRFFFGRGKELIPFAPPQDAKDRPAWAAQIEQQLGQPVAVFVKDGPSLSWVTQPASLAEGIAQVPRLFKSDLSRDERGSIDTVSTYEVRRVSNMLPKGEGFKTWIVGPLARDLRWGVVLDFQDTWPAFFSKLKEAENKSPGHDSPAWAIKEVVYLGGVDGGYKPSMRVLMSGEILYASPKLDTTRYVRRIDSPPMTWEYYQSETDEKYATFIGKGPVSWRHFLAWLMLMVAFFQLYRWIRKLTAPAAR